MENKEAFTAGVGSADTSEAGKAEKDGPTELNIAMLSPMVFPMIYGRRKFLTINHIPEIMELFLN